MLVKRSAQVFTRCRRASRARPVLPVVWLAAGLVGALGLNEAALAATPVGSQFQINSYTTAGQWIPSVAADANGDVVVIWYSDGGSGSDDSYKSIQGQRYDASGNTVGSQFQVNTYTTGPQRLGRVAADPAGGFVVVWQSYGSAGSDTSYYSIQAQRYDASGNAVGSEFQVNTYTNNGQYSPSVASDADGNFVVVWESYQAPGDWSDEAVRARRYHANGNAVGSEFQVNSYTTGSQRNPSVAVAADGSFVVVWDSWGGTGDDTSWRSIQGQRYDATGNAVGTQFQVNTYTTGNQYHPSVAIHAGGSFVVVWDSEGSAAGDSSEESVQGQRYDAGGNPVGSEFQVNTYTTDRQERPSVELAADGEFVVVWTSYGSAGSDTDFHSIQGQFYDAGGNAVGSEFQVNTYTTSWQRYASVAVNGGGEFLVVWGSDGSSGTDNDSDSIQGQRFSVQAPQVPSLAPPGAIGLGLLLFGIAAAELRGRLRGRA